MINAHKNGLRAKGVKPPEEAESGVKNARSYRKISMGRLMARLGIGQYNLPAPLKETALKPKEVQILLGQGIGAPSVPVVQEGDPVKVGSLLAEAPKDGLGCPVHASIEGRVARVTEKYIMVRL